MRICFKGLKGFNNPATAAVFEEMMLTTASH
jgi:hypothetical protein